MGWRARGVYGPIWVTVKVFPRSVDLDRNRAFCTAGVMLDVCALQTT